MKQKVFLKIADKKALKWESIIQAALQLFSINGFHKTTILDIAKKLQMSVGNLYNYFSSKDILAKEIIKYTSEVLGDEILPKDIEYYTDDYLVIFTML